MLTTNKTDVTIEEKESQAMATKKETKKTRGKATLKNPAKDYLLQYSGQVTVPLPMLDALDWTPGKTRVQFIHDEVQDAIILRKS